jgi:phytol kinase
MDKYNTAIGIKRNNRVSILLSGIKGEFVRKILHFLVAIVPFIANVDKTMTILLVATGIIFYTIMEKLRQEGVYVLLISDITVFTSRDRDKGKFVLGPVTLGLGAMLALALYPEPASRIAIYALAFGDGFASLFGKLIGGIKIPFTKGKTLIGSLACFVAVGLITYRILNNPLYALATALVATLLEALPTEDLDNIILPVGTGLFISLLLGLPPA